MSVSTSSTCSKREDLTHRYEATRSIAYSVSMVVVSVLVAATGESWLRLVSHLQEGKQLVGRLGSRQDAEHGVQDAIIKTFEPGRVGRKRSAVTCRGQGLDVLAQVPQCEHVCSTELG